MKGKREGREEEQSEINRKERPKDFIKNKDREKRENFKMKGKEQ